MAEPSVTVAFQQFLFSVLPLLLQRLFPDFVLAYFHRNVSVKNLVVTTLD